MNRISISTILIGMLALIGTSPGCDDGTHDIVVDAAPPPDDAFVAPIPPYVPEPDPRIVDFERRIGALEVLAAELSARPALRRVVFHVGETPLEVCHRLGLSVAFVPGSTIYDPDTDHFIGYCDFLPNTRVVADHGCTREHHYRMSPARCVAPHDSEAPALASAGWTCWDEPEAVAYCGPGSSATTPPVFAREHIPRPHFLF